MGRRGDRHRCVCAQRPGRGSRPDADVRLQPKRRFDGRARQVERRRWIPSVPSERQEMRLDERERRRNGRTFLGHGRRDRRGRRSGRRLRLGGRRSGRGRRHRGDCRRAGRRLGGRRSRRRGHGRRRRRRRRRRVEARRRSRGRLGRRGCRQRLGCRCRCRRRQRRSRRNRRGRRRRGRRRQEAERIEVALVAGVHADAQVDVGNVELGRPARPDRPDRRTLCEHGALRNAERAEMRERHGERVGREDRDALAARGHRPGERHLSGSRRDDGRSRRSPDVDAAVLTTRVRVRRIERERREHRSGHRPRPRACSRDAQQCTCKHHHHNRPHDDSLLLSRWKTKKGGR
jgi:hypothetical protein